MSEGLPVAEMCECGAAIAGEPWSLGGGEFTCSACKSQWRRTADGQKVIVCWECGRQRCEDGPVCRCIKAPEVVRYGGVAWVVVQDDDGGESSIIAATITRVKSRDRQTWVGCVGGDEYYVRHSPELIREAVAEALNEQA